MKRFSALITAVLIFFLWSSAALAVGIGGYFNNGSGFVEWKDYLVKFGI